MAYIRWCDCKRLILTTGQIERNEPCEICQKEHAASLKERLEKDANTNKH